MSNFPCNVLSDSTNTYAGLKRRITESGDSTNECNDKKRVRLRQNAVEEDRNIPMCPGNGSIFSRTHMDRMRGQRRVGCAVTTRPILDSFVSSNKSDIYQLHSQDNPLAPNLPFACAFSRDGKKGGKPVLAVATQEGLVELLDVTKREDWDPEPLRTGISIHQNAILDVKWGHDDQYIGTASGDKTARVTSSTTQQCLAVLAHTNSVKTLDWDPCHPNLLSTGDRNGSICVWDLRDLRRGNSDAYAFQVSSPVVEISNAHLESCGKNAKKVSGLRTVTSVVYLPDMPGQIISAGSYDGKLKQWDLRYPVTTGRWRKPVTVAESYDDPTFSPGSRGRGLSCLTLGRNRTAGLLWGVAADSCVHKYHLPLSAPSSAVAGKLSHPGLFVKSFYVKVALSPCGDWLASGSSSGGIYLWDVGRHGTGSRQAVELKAAGQEVGALDWTDSSLATCCDNGTVRLWRPNLDISRKCKSDPEESRWDWTWTTDDRSIGDAGQMFFMIDGSFLIKVII